MALSILGRLRLTARLAGVALALLAGAAHADQIEEHDDFVNSIVNEQNGNALAADCAAHASFIVTTSPVYDHVRFTPGALDDAHAVIEPWNGAFGQGKQKITVDTMVRVTGQAYRKDSESPPEPVEFRCGYAENKMLAFDYNEPGASRGGQARTRRARQAQAGGHAARSRPGTAGRRNQPRTRP
jgi:hypothetical protein